MGFDKSIWLSWCFITPGNIIYTSRKMIFPPTRKMIHLLGLISVMSCDWRGYISAFYITWLSCTIRQRLRLVKPCDDHTHTRRLHVPGLQHKLWSQQGSFGAERETNSPTQEIIDQNKWDNFKSNFISLEVCLQIQCKPVLLFLFFFSQISFDACSILINSSPVSVSCLSN